MGRLAYGMGLVALALAAHGAQPRCLMSPAQVAMNVPEKGFARLKGQLSEDCGVPPSESRVRESIGPLALYVDADGPSGSGRFWRVTVGIASAGEAGPSRGFCLETSTAGWRTLQHFSRSPLPWLLDLDADRKPELIVWDSFPITKDATAAEFGLVAWVYEFKPPGSFSLDVKASRVLARELAAAYRSGAQSSDASSVALRDAAAQALEAYADARCTTHPTPPKAQR